MIHNRHAKKYLRHVRSVLPCSRKMKAHIMEQIRAEIDLFLEEQPMVDYSALISRFGTPETIAASYVESVGTAEILNSLHVRRRIMCIISIILAFIVITWTATVIFSVARSESAVNGYAIFSTK